MSKREQSALQATFFDVIFGTETPAGKWFDIVLIIVIIASVVVIMLDTLRPDHLGFYGYGKNTSPFLDELSQSFAVFDYAYSTSTWTAPACASLFTGHYPPAHGILEGFFAHDRREKKPETAKPKVTWRGRLPSEPNPGLEVQEKPEKEEGQVGEDGTVIPPRPSAYYRESPWMTAHDSAE